MESKSAGVDDDVYVGHGFQIAQLAQLHRREGGLQRPAAADDHDLVDTLCV